MRVVYHRKKKAAFPLVPASVAVAFFLLAALVTGAIPAKEVTSAVGPLSGKTFVVDAGHGGFDNGASGPNGSVEAPLNLAVSLYLAGELRMLGATVIMTRTDENALASTKKEDMKKRAEILSQDGLTASISIHMNKFTSKKPKGPRVFFAEGSKEGYALALMLQNALDDAAGLSRKEPLTGDYLVLRTGVQTNILVECGFLSNPEDEALLMTEEYQQLLARTIAAAVAGFYGTTTGFPTFANMA